MLWIPGAAGVGFISSFVFADLLRLPSTAYHTIYFALTGGFLAFYAKLTRLPLRATLRRRLAPAVAVGVLGGLALTHRVLGDPRSVGPSGLLFVWDVLWRGVLYGMVDGALLSAVPWLVSWRALYGESSTLARRVGINLLALGFALLVTSGYHLGYREFRGPKLAQANLGNAIASLPTLLTMNPLASPITHAALHIAAVVHNPQSNLFLPPHEPSQSLEAREREAAPVTENPVIDFPLRGVWRVFQPPGHPPQALDFVALGADMRCFSAPWLTYLLWAGPAAHWQGWRQPVYAPLEGTVVVASDGWPDRETVNLIRDTLGPLVFRPRAIRGNIRPFAGNYVIIQSGSLAAFLAHLRQGSVRVSAGQRVTPADVVGEVGNSGNSLAPHLHLQLMDEPDPEAARLVPFLLRCYERWNGRSWELAHDRAPVGGDRIRSTVERTPPDDSEGGRR